MIIIIMLMMMIMHVYRKFVIFLISIFIHDLKDIIYFFKVLLGVLCNREYTFRTWCNKKEAGHILAIYTYLLSISPVITLISTCSRYGIYFIDYMINQY